MDYRVYFLILAPLLSGCMAGEGGVLTIADRSHLGAEVGYVVVSSEGGGTNPCGPLKVGQVCPVCDGKGKVGDGRVFVDCHTCGGDGRIDEKDLEPGGGDSPDGDFGETIDLGVVRMTNSRWTWENRGTNAPVAFRRSHLIGTHGIDPDVVAELSGDEMNALHDNLHSTGKSGLSNEPPPMVKVESAGSSCPTGNCPGSSSSGRSSSRRGIFGGLFRGRR